MGKKRAAASEKSAVGRVAHPDAGALRITGAQRCWEIHFNSHYHRYACARFRRGSLVRPPCAGHRVPPRARLYAAAAGAV